MNTPKQSRSQQTMNRMLDAAETLLETKSWQELTIQEVVKHANSSVGAFYGRFKDKDGLLQALDKRYFDILIGLIESSVNQPEWQTLNLDETVYKIADLIVALHSGKQGVLRTLILQARLVNDPRFRGREERLMEHMPQLVDFILKHRSEIKHDDVSGTIQFGLLQMFYSAREMLIWPHISETLPVPKSQLTVLLAKACIGFFRCS